VALTLAQMECDRNKNAVPVTYSVYKHGGSSCTSCKISDIDGRLSLNDLKDQIFNWYLYRMWKANIPSHYVKCPHLLVSVANRKESTTI
jgi:hypothetical protein